ncbi:hypothetical protein [Janthinobacterium sp. TND4EL3]|uniref:hypothetical protein n=1 Tax=Janthinobacterium sp. TND4EL3 TaxID=1907311 RepID=UPI00111586DE|nr:hypothetical protein [Janthinobacterium sp. TND4EL3]
MGIWDSIKKTAMKAKCGMGFHAGTGKNVEGKPLCYFENLCPDCNETIKVSKHNYPLSWEDAGRDYDSDNKCTKVQKCDHCDHQMRKVVHAEYERVGKNGRCQIIEKCVQCGDEKTGSESHSWYRYGSQENSSNVTVKCHDCQKTETRSHF